jgi:hygromycin-B 4-O-kinase
MSTRKTKIESEQVLKFLQENFDKTVSNLTLLKGGELSCPYSFTSSVNEYIIRIDSQIASYQKDEYAWKHFGSSQLSIPEMIRSGKFDEKLYFSITRKVNGKTLDMFSDNEIKQIIPSIISTLGYIHSIDISNTNGYGYWDKSGNANFQSWKEYITTVDKHNKSWLKNPEAKYDKLLNKIYEKIIVLCSYCSEERYLLHGDFGFNNVISDGKNITAVLDWGEGMYGDFIYDIAWLDAWQETIKYEDIFYQYYKKIGKKIPYFKERVLLYKLFIYYGSIIFFVQSDQKEEAIKLERDIQPLL